MMRRALVICALVTAVAAVAILPIYAAQAAKEHAPPPQSCQAVAMYCPLGTAGGIVKQLESVPTPDLVGPPAPVPVVPIKPLNRIITYEVITRGSISADLATFKTLANQTLNDARGWRYLGVEFKEVASGGQFTLVLSAASQVPTFGSICDNYYSCRVGRFVVINQDRWQSATDPWNNAGGSLRDYRHMVINHETGHWLGHGHRNCMGAGQLAPVMQQQSYDLQGCTFNPWPLNDEMWSTTLGI